MSRRGRTGPAAFHDADERDMIGAFERGEYQRLPPAQEKRVKAELQAAARAWMATERREARINIRVRPSDLAALKVKAAAEGLPYQTLVASLIHKYVAPHVVVTAPATPAARKRRTA
jgi:predicted DNA binding CopG/RHH family protein